MPDFELTAGVIPLDKQIQCVAREVTLRKRCYPRWVAQKRLSEKQAQQEIERMEAVLHTLQELAGRD